LAQRGVDVDGVPEGEVNHIARNGYSRGRAQPVIGARDDLAQPRQHLQRHRVVAILDRPIRVIARDDPLGQTVPRLADVSRGCASGVLAQNRCHLARHAKDELRIVRDHSGRLYTLAQHTGDAIGGNAQNNLPKKTRSPDKSGRGAHLDCNTVPPEGQERPAPTLVRIDIAVTAA
jgi:hypothetical protein